MKYIKDIERRLASLENMTGGKGVSVTRRPGGLVIAMKPAASGPSAASPAEDCSGGDVLVLNRDNPEADWGREDDKRPVSWIGNYVTWDKADDKKLMLHYRILTYDKCGRVKAISAEIEAEIDEAVECICDGGS